jgi:N-acetylmuramoyl-L-alanine amidase
VKRLILCLTVCWFVLSGLSLTLAQERHNYLAINDELADDDIGPYYFIRQGNSTDAYAKASLFARAFGLDVIFDNATKTLSFRQHTTIATFQATDNIAEGLQKREGALNVNGERRVSPKALIVDGVSYVAISPLVAAFGGVSEFDSRNLVLFVESAPPPAPVAATPEAQQSTPTTTTGALSTPRYAFHTESSRVAVDIPAGSEYQVFVEGSQLVIQFPTLSAAAFQRAVDDPFLEQIRIGSLTGSPALIIDTRYPLNPSGTGYRVALLPTSSAKPDHEVLYVDFAPQLSGQAVSTLSERPEALSGSASATPVPVATAPGGNRKVVVIDAGHGGKFPGAQGYVAEEKVVLAISLKLQALLEAQGIEVRMTRTGDYHLGDTLRADLAARANLATPDINLFISVHANSAESNSAHGIETYVFGRPLNDSLIALAIKENGGGELGRELTAQAQQVANNITGNIFREGQLNYSLKLAEMVQNKMVAATGARDRGVKQNVFYVLSNARSPAILVEVGFVNNPQEGPKLGTTEYQTLLANALAEGIINFLHQGDPIAQQQ